MTAAAVFAWRAAVLVELLVGWTCDQSAAGSAVEVHPRPGDAVGVSMSAAALEGGPFLHSAVATGAARFTRLELVDEDPRCECGLTLARYAGPDVEQGWLCSACDTDWLEDLFDRDAVEGGVAP